MAFNVSDPSHVLLLQYSEWYDTTGRRMDASKSHEELVVAFLTERSEDAWPSLAQIEVIVGRWVPGSLTVRQQREARILYEKEASERPEVAANINGPVPVLPVTAQPVQE